MFTNKVLNLIACLIISCVLALSSKAVYAQEAFSNLVNANIEKAFFIGENASGKEEKTSNSPMTHLLTRGKASSSNQKKTSNPPTTNWMPGDKVPSSDREKKIILKEKNSDQRYKIGVIDLMLLKRQKLGAVPLAREVGADGLEVDMGGLGDRETFDNKLEDTAVLRQYLEAAAKEGIGFCALGMTGFYAQSFAERPTYERMIQDCINTMKKMNVKVGFLPLGVKGDLVAHPELRPAIVERLKVVGKMAKKAGVVIGIETSLSASEEVKLLKDIGSGNIQIYFNFSNPIKAGRDLHEELRILGKDRICQIHCSNGDGVWLQNDPAIDMKKVKETLDKMKWSGWLVVERSRDANDPRNVKKNFGANVAYMKSVFQ